MPSTTTPLPPVAATGGCFSTMKSYASSVVSCIVKTAKAVAATVAPVFARMGQFLKAHKITVGAVLIGAAIGSAMTFLCCRPSAAAPV